MEINYIIWLWDNASTDRVRFRTASKEAAEKLIKEAEEAKIPNSGVLEIPASYIFS